MTTTTIPVTADALRGPCATPSGYSPRYEVIREANGFRVEGRDRRPAYVRLSPGKTLLLIANAPDTFDLYDERGGYFRGGFGYTCGLYGYYRLLDALANLVMLDWKRPEHPPSDWSGIYEWALGRTKRALHFRGVYGEWQRLVALVPDPQRSLARKVFAATFDAKIPGCETWPEIFAHPYLIQDILRYRAAASACHYAERLVSSMGAFLFDQRERDPELVLPQGIGERCLAYHKREQAIFLLARAQPDDYERGRQALRTEVLAILAQDWKALFSPWGKAGKSLRRTLMNLPGGISGSMLYSFPSVGDLLARPLTDRLVLLTFLSFARTFPDPTALSRYWEGRIYAQSSHQEIAAALHRLSEHLDHPIPATRAGVGVLVWFIADYCRACRLEDKAPHMGKLPALVEKAAIWHRQREVEIEARQRLMEEEAARLRKERLTDLTPTSLPPIPLPKNSAVRFLESVGAVYQEEEDMIHCIGSLARSAVIGTYYLFHVEYAGERASVQVSRGGEVIQSWGPKNRANAASDYGRLVLSRWGSRLRRSALALQSSSGEQVPRGDGALDLLGDGHEDPATWPF